MNADLRRLQTALQVRRFEELLLAAANEINGHYHVSIGLEATAAGLREALRTGDRVVTNYRNHGHLIALGSDPKTMYGEIFGRAGGPQHGRSGSLHLADPERGVLYTSAMVAGGLPIALGIAFALAHRRTQSVVFCFFGDGALQEGCSHEALTSPNSGACPSCSCAKTTVSRSTAKQTTPRARRASMCSLRLTVSTPRASMRGGPGT